MLHIVKEEKTPETALWAVAALSCWFLALTL